MRIAITSYEHIVIDGERLVKLADLCHPDIDAAAFQVALDYFVMRRIGAGVFSHTLAARQAVNLTRGETSQAASALAQRANELKGSTDLAALQALAADVARPVEERRARVLQAKKAALLAEVSKLEAELNQLKK